MELIGFNQCFTLIYDFFVLSLNEWESNFGSSRFHLFFQSYNHSYVVMILEP